MFVFVEIVRTEVQEGHRVSIPLAQVIVTHTQNKTKQTNKQIKEEERRKITP